MVRVGLGLGLTLGLRLGLALGVALDEAGALATVVRSGEAVGCAWVAPEVHAATSIAMLTHTAGSADDAPWRI